MGAQAIPTRLRVWVAASTVSQIGDAFLYFGLGWYASAQGRGRRVLAAVTGPRAMLMLGGGAGADRGGPRPVLRAAVPGEVRSLVGEIRAGLRVAAADPALRWVFGLYAVAGGLVLPLEALLLPLLARSAGWSPAATGLVAGGRVRRRAGRLPHRNASAGGAAGR